MKSRDISKHNKQRLERLSVYLRELRINQGVTQDEFSQNMQLHRNTVKRAEKAYNLTLISLFKFADELEIELSELFSICEEK
jgi:transcriptional regulator with XRE-family HTH domain